MSTIAKMSPAVAGGSPYQLDYAMLVAAGYVVPETEIGAAEQYIFDAAVPGVLRNRMSSYVAAPSNPAGATPSVLSDRVVLDGAYGGLLLGTPDQTEITVAAIYQRPPGTITNVLPIIGTDTGTPGGTGFGIFTADTVGLNLSIRPGTGDPAIISAVAGPLVPNGAWAFVAASLSPTDTAIHLGHGGTLTTAAANGVARALAAGGSLTWAPRMDPMTCLSGWRPCGSRRLLRTMCWRLIAAPACYAPGAAGIWCKGKGGGNEDLVAE